MKRLLFLLLFAGSFSAAGQDWSSIGKKIIYSDTLKQARKYTSVDRALKDPEHVYYLDIYCQKSGENIRKFSNNIRKFRNLRKLIINNQSGSVVELPEQIWNLDQLEFLQIVNVQNLETEKIQNLKHLKYLTLDGFGFSAFPSAVLELKQLEFLDLSCNFLSALPGDISMLENLKEIELTSNCFTEVPPQLSELKMLTYITMNNAEWGFLANGKEMCRNSVTVFPEVLGKLSKLKRVACFYRTNTNDEMKKKIKAAYPGIKFS
ncbi:MAG: leucine-rich repeat domain-containing protein [Bacteroidia bacterium]